MLKFRGSPKIEIPIDSRQPQVSKLTYHATLSRRGLNWFKLAPSAHGCREGSVTSVFLGWPLAQPAVTVRLTTGLCMGCGYKQVLKGMGDRRTAFIEHCTTSKDHCSVSIDYCTVYIDFCTVLYIGHMDHCPASIDHCSWFIKPLYYTYRPLQCICRQLQFICRPQLWSIGNSRASIDHCTSVGYCRDL